MTSPLHWEGVPFRDVQDIGEFFAAVKQTMNGATPGDHLARIERMVERAGHDLAKIREAGERKFNKETEE